MPGLIIYGFFYGKKNKNYLIHISRVQYGVSQSYKQKCITISFNPKSKIPKLSGVPTGLIQNPLA
jgi:hypothetical protein